MVIDRYGSEICLIYFGVIKINVFETIMNRRSVRKFNKKDVTKEDINILLEAAHRAPSAKNSQPWKFIIIQDRIIINDISTLSIYKSWMRESACLIIVYLDKQRSYEYKKDLQAIGAAIQNILLAAHELGLGSCWIGEILKSDEVINKMLEANTELELMAVLAIGYTDESKRNIVRRINIGDCIIKWL